MPPIASEPAIRWPCISVSRRARPASGPQRAQSRVHGDRRLVNRGALLVALAKRFSMKRTRRRTGCAVCADEEAQVEGIDARRSTRGACRLWTMSSALARTRLWTTRGAAQLGASLASRAGRTGVTIRARDAGIGKSRLIGELRRLALEAGFACHTGLFRFGMAMDDAIREIVAGLMDQARGG
jgi:hypothetical protein